MWILSFVPDAWLHLAIYLILASGVGLYVASFFTKFIPPLIPYSGVVRILATILMVSGVYFYGGYSTEMSWRDKVADLEKQVQESEKKSAEANTKLKTVFVDKVKIVKDTQVIIQKQIVENEKVIDADCRVPKEAIDILNFAAKRPEVKK